MIAATLALVVGAIILWATGVDVARASRAFVTGALGTRYGITETLIVAVPLCLSALSVALSFRAGLFNIGAEGQILAGMLAATAAATLGGTGRVATLAAATLGGGLLALVAAWLHLRRSVPEVLATLLLNFVMIYTVSGAVHGALQEEARAYPRSAPIPADAALPIFWPRLHAGVLLAAVAVPIVWLLVRRTTFGLRMRAAGAAPRAARLAGFPVVRDLTIVFLVSGALAGLAGGIEICGVTHRLYEHPSAGVGYTAIAVALLGRLSPAGVLLAALFFAALDAGAAAMQRAGFVSNGFAYVLQGVALVVLLGLESPRVKERLASRRSADSREVSA